MFTKPRTAITGPHPANIPIPKICQDGTSDYEAELCVVIGSNGRDIPEEKALDYVLGYTASNDVSARQLQNLTGQWSYSKGIDGSCPLGMYYMILGHTKLSHTKIYACSEVVLRTDWLPYRTGLGYRSSNSKCSASGYPSSLQWRACSRL